MNIAATSYVTHETQHESKPNTDINSCHPDLQFFHDPWRRERKGEKGINSDQGTHSINNLNFRLHFYKLKLNTLNKRTNDRPIRSITYSKFPGRIPGSFNIPPDSHGEASLQTRRNQSFQAKAPWKSPFVLDLASSHN